MGWYTDRLQCRSGRDHANAGAVRAALGQADSVGGDPEQSGSHRREGLPMRALSLGWGAVRFPQGRRGVSIGEVLADARRRAGLNVTEVSQQTRIRETIIAGIQGDDYSACGGDFAPAGTSVPSRRRSGLIRGR